MCLLIRNATEIEGSWPAAWKSFSYTLDFLISTWRNVNGFHLSMNVTFFMGFYVFFLFFLEFLQLYGHENLRLITESNQSINNIENNVIVILILVYLAWISHQRSVLMFLPLSYDSSYFSQMKATKIPSCSNSIHCVLPNWDNNKSK